MRVMQKLRYQLSIKAVKRTLDQLVGVRIPVPQKSVANKGEICYKLWLWTMT
jgi:hypothetical protein